MRHTKHHNFFNASILAILVAAFAAFWLAPAYAQNDSVIRFGVSPSFPPYESVNAQGELVGLDIEIGNAICQHLEHKTCEWVRINFTGAIPALKAKKIDAILSAMAVTKKRKKRVLFSIPFNKSLSTLVTRENVTLDSTAASLKGKTVGVAQGTMQAAYAKKHWAGKGVNLVTYQNESLMQQDLTLGRLDAMFTDVPFSHTFLQSPAGENFHMTGHKVPVGHGEAIAMRPGDYKLKKKIDSALRAMARDGTFQKIMAKYAKYGIIGTLNPKGE